MLPKKDDKFKRVITHLKTTSLPQMSSKYSELRAQVVNYQLDVFSRTAAFVPSMQGGSLNTTLAAMPAIPVNSYTHDNSSFDNYAFTGDLMDDPMFGMVNDWDPPMEWM